MMEWKGFALEGDRTSKTFKADDGRRLYKSEGEEVQAFRSERAIVTQVRVFYYQGLGEGLGDAMNSSFFQVPDLRVPSEYFITPEPLRLSSCHSPS